MKYIWQECSFCSYTIACLVIHFFIHFQSAHSLVLLDKCFPLHYSSHDKPFFCPSLNGSSHSKDTLLLETPFSCFSFSFTISTHALEKYYLTNVSLCIIYHMIKHKDWSIKFLYLNSICVIVKGAKQARQQ